MKSNLLWLTVILLLILNIHAQQALKKHVYSLSGSLSFSHSDIETESGENQFTLINLTPGATYFFFDNFSAGLNITYAYVDQKVKAGDVENRYINRPYSFGPGARYYFAFTELIPFLEVSFGYSNILRGNNDKYSFAAAAGINYFLSESIALEPFIGFTTEKYIISNKTDSQFSFGVRINYFIIPQSNRDLD